jgi:hypothetical protein
MPHLSRLLAASCAIAFILVSLPIQAGIGDKDLPLLAGRKPKLLYTVVGVRDGASLATVFFCTSTERSGGATIQLGIEVFQWSGALLNDVTAGFGRISISPGQTWTLTTRNVLGFTDDNLLSTGPVDQGSARIFASSKNIICSAMIVDAINAPPTSMVMLPVFRTTKQKGM